MRNRSRHLYAGGIALAMAILLITMASRDLAGQRPAVATDADDIGGVVTGPRGPEAGVWVIAETTNLPTKFMRIVVTDDQGRFLVPDLPKASYNVWARGYGLVDSSKAQAQPGQLLNLMAIPAANAKAAAEYYPAQYWLSLMRLPGAHDFPGTGPQGNGISPNIKNQEQWIADSIATDACISCHQIGNKLTRTMPTTLGPFASSAAGWERRIQSGQAGGQMIGRFNQIGKERALGMYADWTDRIAAGEYPKAAPPRPQGIERNVVITMWDWADPKAYLHDEIASDKRDPRVNANGPIYGALEASADYMPVVDPVANTTSQVKLEVRDPNTPTTGEVKPAASSQFWDDEAIWNSRANAHSFAMDEQARVWVAARVRPNQTSAFCREGSTHPSAQAYPINQSGRQMSMYDPKTKKVTTIDLCFGTHHLNFAEDNNDTLWFCGGGQVVGWFNTKLYDETKDEQKAQGWTALVLDTNGNGKRDAYVEPDQPIDPTKDKRISAPFYGVAPEPDGRIDLGVDDRLPGRRRSPLAGLESAGDGARGVLRAADEGRPPGRRVLAARHGRRSQRRRLDGHRQRPPGQLRSPQVQGSAEWSEGDRPALRRRLHRVSAAGTSLPGLGRGRQRRLAVLHVRRSLRHARYRQQQRADGDGE